MGDHEERTRGAKSVHGADHRGPIAVVELRKSIVDEADTDLTPGKAGPTGEVKTERIMARMMTLALRVENLRVKLLPPLGDVAELSVGRQPDNEVVVDDESVSGRHAVLRWDEERRRCTLRDLDSKNGTFVNAITRIEKEVVLKDGDIVFLGEAALWFSLAESLHAKLAQPVTPTIPP